MKKIKYSIKYICYFIIGFLIVTIFASKSQIDILKELNIEINVKEVVLHTMRDEIALYTIIYLFILILNVLYNVRLIKRLNEESQKMRKIGEEKILKERRDITMKRKVLILIATVLAIFLILFIVNNIRKAIILEKYTKAVEQRSNSTNYYVKNIHEDGEVTSEAIGKDNIKIYRSISEDGTSRMIYQEGNQMMICIDEPSGRKTALKVEGGVIPIFNGGDLYFDSIYEVENLWGKIKLILETKITTEKLNDKECYRFYINDDLQSFVNKEDMVSIKTVNGSSEMEYVEYKIGTVTDEDIEKIKPKLDEYTVKEN